MNDPVRGSLRRLVVSLVLVCGCTATSPVDPKLTGTWDLQVPTAAGLSRWVWEIHENGTYDFHAEGPGDAPSHSGTFSASGGKYTLVSTTMAWNDDGTYRLEGDSTMVASGRLGTASWHRIATGPHDPPSAPRASPPSEHAEPPSGRALVANIYDCTGLPFATIMDLRDDGKYEIDGDAFGRPTFHLGTYTVEGNRVKLRGTFEVQGHPDLDQKDDRLEFDRQPDGSLKAAGEMAQLPVACTPMDGTSGVR